MSELMARLHLSIRNGVPQGSILGPMLFVFFIYNFCKDVKDAKFHFYANDTILYTSASSVSSAMSYLQAATTQSRGTFGNALD